MSAPKRGAIQRFGRKIRFRIFWILVAFGAGASTTWSFHEAIFGWLLAPAHGKLSPYGSPIFTSPVEMLGMTISLAIKGGLVVAFPVLVFSIFGLVSPLLNPRRRRFIRLFLPMIFLCYLGGAAFAYFVMLPTGLRFLLNFGTNVAIPFISITAYMSIATAMLFWLGIVFEIPLVMFMLVHLRLVSRRRLATFRKYVPFAAFFVGAIITPTFDAVNQTMVAVPVIALYEFGLFLSWIAEGGAGAVARKVKAMVIWVWRRPVVAFKATWRSIKRWWEG